MRRRTRRNLAFSSIVLVGTFAALEVGSRLFFPHDLSEAAGPPPQPQSGAPTMQGSPYLLWEQAPGVRIEHGKKAHINSLGLRGEEPEIPKPAGVKRLLATGDSSVYGFGVEDDEPFVNVAARELGEQVEGWNAAIPGYSTYQSINMLEMRALALEPDVLVIGNLWSDNNFDSFVDKELLSAYAGFDDSLGSRLHQLLEPSAFYRLLNYRLRVMEGDAADARKVGWTVGRGDQKGRRRVEVNDYAANLERLVEIAEDNGAEPVFVLLSNREDVIGREDKAAWSLYREVMRDSAGRLGVPLIDVPQLFLGSGLGPNELFVDEMHPTAEGHRIVGEALAETLEPWMAGGTIRTEGNGEPLESYEDTFLFREGGAGKTEEEQERQPVDPEQAGPPVPMGGGPTVSGRLSFDAHRGNTLILDILDCEEDRNDRIGGTTIPKPGPWRAELNKPASIICFVVHEDVNRNGAPDAGDIRLDLSHRELSFSEDMQIIIDLDELEASAG